MIAWFGGLRECQEGHPEGGGAGDGKILRLRPGSPVGKYLATVEKGVGLGGTERRGAVPGLMLLCEDDTARSGDRALQWQEASRLRSESFGAQGSCPTGFDG
jgi:hypothetical protein